MNYFQCTEKVDGYPLDCKYTFKRWELSWLSKLPVGNFGIRSTIWVWRVEYENLALNFFVIRGDMCPNGFYAQKKRSQSDRCTVAFSNIAMFQYFSIFGVVSLISNRNISTINFWRQHFQNIAAEKSHFWDIIYLETIYARFSFEFDGVVIRFP